MPDKPVDSFLRRENPCANLAPAKIRTDKYKALKVIKMALKIKNGTSGCA